MRTLLRQHPSVNSAAIPTSSGTLHVADVPVRHTRFIVTRYGGPDVFQVVQEDRPETIPCSTSCAPASLRGRCSRFASVPRS